MDAADYRIILDSLDTTGVYVIREDNHKILYFNQKVADVVPNIALGKVCQEAWSGSCGRCPLTDIGNRRTNQSFNYDGPDHKPIDITATRVLWDEEIPAFVITFSPHADTYNTTYEKIVKGNLTTNACEAVKMVKEERDRLPEEGFTLTMALDSFVESGLLHPEDIERFRRFSSLEHMSRELLKEKRTLVCNYRRRSADGYHWNTMEVLPDSNYTEDSQSIMIYVKDVQNIYREGLEHEELNLKNEAILSTLGKENFGIYSIDLLTGQMELIRVADEDTSFINEYNNNWDEVLEELLRRRYHPDYHDRFRESFSREALVLMQDSGRAKSELIVERKIGGSYHYISATAHFQEPIYGKNHVLLAFQDIDERARKEFRDRMVLRDAYDAANLANASKSEFLSRMSHDIRTPMNAIVGMTEIAGAHLDEPARVAECLDKIAVSSKYLLSLVNEVLDLSKIESGKLDFSEEAFSLSKLFDDMITILQPTLNAKGLQLTLTRDEFVHDLVIGDTLRLQQVFTNILSNAIKYTPQGGRIEVSIHELPAAPNGYGSYEFVFRDTGIGMSQEYLTHIFEPFSRAEDVRTSKIEGSGLGMVIARNIMLMMGGDIRVKSKENVGSEFTVSVSLKLGEVQSAPTQQQLPKRGEALDTLGQRDFSGKRILLVEDNDLNREIATEIIGMTGVTIECAVNGQDAVDKFAASRLGYYDLIFMDVRMPILNGYQATQAIRAMPRADAMTVPIIAMTADAFTSDIQASREAGMDEHISKPLNFAVLTQCLDRFLSKS